MQNDEGLSEFFIEPLHGLCFSRARDCEARWYIQETLALVPWPSNGSTVDLIYLVHLPGLNLSNARNLEARKTNGKPKSFGYQIAEKAQIVEQARSGCESRTMKLNKTSTTIMK